MSKRKSGVLLHITSLPGPFGLGELGEEAYRFVDRLVDMGQSVWQVLPLNPTLDDGCPYTSPSGRAGNASLASIQRLIANGYLQEADAAALRAVPRDSIPFMEVLPLRNRLIRQAAQNFLDRNSTDKNASFDAFCSTQGSLWLDDYALFSALQEAHDNTPWPEWPAALRDREPNALDEARQRHAVRINEIRVEQWFFDCDWRALKAYTNDKGIELFGDMPIYVAHNSVDVWAAPDNFLLDDAGQPYVVAGCPPDALSVEGQRWGNPLYNWTTQKARGFDWWIARMERMLDLFDIIRVDHFRAFAGFWEIDAKEETAVNGRWVSAPGHDLFRTFANEMPKAPIVAEDLGLITPDVDELRLAFDLPGMKIVQFEIGEHPIDENKLPVNYPERSVTYIGTHDNSTALGWYKTLNEEIKTSVDALIGADLAPNWALTRLALGAGSSLVVHQLQDILGLDDTARMNVPGVSEGNWHWRFEAEDLTQEAIEHLSTLTAEAGRSL